MRPKAIHPLFIAIFPILALFWANLGMVAGRELAAPILISVVSAALLWAALRPVLRDANKAAILTSLALFLFYSYGHLFRYSGSHKYPCLISALVFIGGLILLARTRKTLDGLTRLLNVTSLFLVVFTGIAAVQVLARPAGGSGVQADPAAAPEAGNHKEAEAGAVKQPDIYYVILDEYGRSDLLGELYGHDNSGFLEHLIREGFFVATEGRSNYNTTSLSLASSLNMDYIQNLVRPDAAGGGPQSADNGTLLWKSRVVSFLRERGYRIVTFASSVAITDYMASDLRLAPPRSMSEFQNILIGSTALSAAVRLFNNLGVMADFQYDRHRDLITFAFERLPRVGGGDAPVFTFVHTMACHPPFVFDSDGRPVTPNYLFGLGGRGDMRLEGVARTEYIESYRRQLVHVNRLVERAVDRIIEHSPDAVIIVQGDHGPRSRYDCTSPEKTDLNERMSIFNAIRLPGGAGPQASGRLYPAMTPVNTFRLIFNRLFDARFETLDDRCYFAPDERVFRFIDVTDRVERAGERRVDASTAATPFSNVDGRQPAVHTNLTR